MKVVNRTLLTMAAVALLSACSVFDDDDDDVDLPPAPQVTKARVVHASPDAPKVDVLAGGTTAVNDLDFANATPYFNASVGTVSATVQGVTPGGNVTVIGPANLTLNADRNYTLIATGNVANITLDIIDASTAAVPSGSTQVTVFHGAPNAPGVDVYVTAPTADLASAAALGNFSFRQKLGPVTVSNGDYRIRVTPTGNRSTVVFDSGTVSLTGGDLLLVALQNILATEIDSTVSPINLLLSDGTNPSSIIRDANTPAALRVVHNSPDAPAVDVVVNDNFAAPLVNALAFPNFTPYVTVPPDSYNVKVAADADNSIVAINADLDLAANSVSTVAAVGPLASIEPLVQSDRIRRIATEAQVRLTHGSPTAGNVDIYVTPMGTDINTVSANFSNVPFKADTGYVSLAAGRYDVTITPTGSKTAAIGPLTVTLENGGIYSAIARDAAGGGLPLGVILLDDFAP